MRWIAITFPLFVGPTAAAAQIEFRGVTGDPGARANGGVAVLSDLDGDGVADIAIGSPNANLGFGTNAGAVRFVSGATGQVLATIHGGVAQDRLGHTLVRVEDLDGDGLAELAMTFHGSGRRVEVRSAGNGPVLFTFTPPAGLTVLSDPNVSWGSTLACVGDVNLDGVPDLAIGGPNNGLVELVEIRSGSDGSLLTILQGDLLPDSTTDRNFGTAIAGLGDLNGDGRSEVAVGAPNQWSQCAFQPEGGVAIYSPPTWTRIRLHGAGCVGPNAAVEELGTAIVSVGDVTGDGVPDYAAEARYPGPGRVVLYSGANGAVLAHWNTAGTTPTLHTRGTLVRVGDVDGDGRADLAVTTRDSDTDSIAFGIQNTIQVFSTKSPSYAVLDSLRGMRGFGRRLADLGDIDGNGTRDLLVLQPDYLDHQGAGSPGQHWLGRLSMYSLSEFAADAVRYCTSSANSTGARARIWHEGSLRLADDALELLSWNLPAAQFGIFFYCTNAATMPLGNGTRCIGGATVRLPVVSTGSAGIATSALPLANPLPGVPIQSGVPMRFQFWYRDPAGGGAGFDLSDACQLTFVP